MEYYHVMYGIIINYILFQFYYQFPIPFPKQKKITMYITLHCTI